MINQKVKETLTLTSKQNQDQWREDSNSRFGPRSGSKPDDKREVLLIMISKTIQKKLKSRWVKDFI